jgi:D-alanyl-D-alanine carboxypeptidase (penicillin-binding protein 5/6)
VQKFSLNLTGAAKPIPSYIKEDVTIDYYPAEEPDLKSRLIWDKTLQLPISKDQLLGEIMIQTENGQWLRKIPIYASEEGNSTWNHWFKSLFSGGQGGVGIIKALGILAAVVLVVFFVFQLRGRS